MPESRPIVRLPSLPSWEKLLTRLSVLPEAKIDQRSLRLEVIGLISNDHNSLTQLWPRLCALLPKIASCQGVIIWARSTTGNEIIASNLSPKKALACIEPRTIQRLAKSGHRFFNKRFTGKVLVGTAPLTNYHQVSLGEADARDYFLLAVGTRAISSETIRALEVTCQIVNLRLKNHCLAQGLKSQDLKLNNLTQQLGEGMAILDSNHKVILWNRAIQRLTGYKTAEAINQNIDKVFCRTDQPDWLASVVQEHRSDDVRHSHFDFEISTKGNERRWLSCLVSVYTNDADEVEQIALVARDISHRKILEQKKNEFISIATHELRTPLTAIKGYLSLLERQNQNLTAKQLNYLSQATKASNRLVRLAEDLLRVTQIDQDRIQFKPRTLHLFPLVKKVVRDFKPKAAAKGLTLSLSKSQSRDLVHLDPERTEQIFANLIDNATKYSEQGAIKVWLENTEDRHGQNPQLVINVRDSGIGIGIKNIEEIFEKFHRAHRPEQSREQGAGLGLYIVKSFVEKQNGIITVKSRAGKGTHFAVAFPLELAKRSK